VTLSPAVADAGSVTVDAAGDIACSAATTVDPVCADDTTAALMESPNPVPDAILPLGDNQYEAGSLQEFNDNYANTWGVSSLLLLEHPVPGNHEYTSGSANGYFSYFGAPAGSPSTGYYSYDLGTWHIIALNSNCKSLNDCGPVSTQEEWLRGDLAAHPNTCTLAYWHHPLFTIGQSPPDAPNSTTTAAFLQALWQDLYDAGADIVLTGHDHNYQRWAPQTPAGAPDPTHGIREFVVGTGGRDHHAFISTNANVGAQNDDTFGILRLTLNPGSYGWEFVPTNAGGFTDSGSDTCHAKPGAIPQPSPGTSPAPQAPPGTSQPPESNAPGGTPDQASSGTAVLKLQGRSVTINLKSGRGTMASTCDNVPADHCAVALQLTGSSAAAARKRTVIVGAAKGTIAGDKTGRLTFRLTRKGLTLLRERRAHTVKVTARGSSKNRLGTATKLRQRLTLRGKRTPKR